MRKEIIYSIDQDGNFDWRGCQSALDIMIALQQTTQIFTFTGPLGAGKTTFIQSFLRANGVEGVITSPTFTYVNTYHTAEGNTYYHFDLYRLTSVEEFLSLGFDEYLYKKNSWALIEWPEVISSLLTHNVSSITIDYYDNLRARKMLIVNE